MKPSGGAFEAVSSRGGVEIADVRGRDDTVWLAVERPRHGSHSGHGPYVSSAAQVCAQVLLPVAASWLGLKPEDHGRGEEQQHQKRAGAQQEPRQSLHAAQPRLAGKHAELGNLRTTVSLAWIGTGSIYTCRC